MRLHLVRHGESTWNVERRLQGQQMEVPLTSLGRAQAASAAEELARHRVVAVWSSDQLRAADTASVIAAQLQVPLRLCAELREQSLGALEGRGWDELVAEETPAGVDISEVRWGGGESVADVYQRLTRLVSMLSSFGHDDELVLVSHGDTLRVLLAVLAGRGHREVDWDDAFANGEVRSISV